MLISVVIPTKDRPRAVVAAVLSVLRGDDQDVEVIVVDQSPGDDTQVALQRAVRDTRLHLLTNRRPGYGAASSRNLGLAYSQGELLAVTDDDVEARSDWVARIRATFDADATLDLVAGRLSAPEYDRDAGFIPEFDADPTRDLARAALHVSGANFSFRPRVLETVGGYDEFCGPGSRLRASDDTDFCHRVLRAGLRVELHPEIEVVHVNGFRDADDARTLSLRYSFGNGGNYGRFLRHGDVRAGARFVAGQARHALRLLRAPAEIADPEWVLTRQRMAGFAKGVMLPAREGFVGPTQFAQLRSYIQSAREASGC